jgi:hypothetical protein
MEIRIQAKFLINNNLTISEYIYLKNSYEKNSDSEIVDIIDNLDLDSLQLRGFIRITDSEILLRNKTNELFEGKNLFLKFMNTFPIKTPSGRYLSPLRMKTTKADVLEKKWKKLFKNNPSLEENALKVLEAELKWRKRNNSLEYIHNMEAWLNQGDYDNYAYLVEEDKEENHKDFM